MIAVLRTAVEDCCDEAVRRIAGREPRDPHAYRQAVAYVESRDRSWPFSFENICEAVGFDAESIRRGVRRACASDR
jgi:hypothetical protein